MDSVVRGEPSHQGWARAAAVLGTIAEPEARTASWLENSKLLRRYGTENGPTSLHRRLLGSGRGEASGNAPFRIVKLRKLLAFLNGYLKQMGCDGGLTTQPQPSTQAWQVVNRKRSCLARPTDFLLYEHFYPGPRP